MSRFLFFLYRNILNFLYILLSPFLRFLLPKAENNQRLGFQTPSLSNCIWVHAASVGEVNACKQLVIELLARYPKRDILLTTTSTTGMKTAKQIDARLHTHLLPLDIPILMRKFIQAIHPDIVILIETEIWPVMLYLLKKKKVPVILVNARISDRSYPKYKRMKLLWSIIKPCIKQINAQSDLDVDRFQSLGFSNVVNALNLKFALKLPAYQRNELRSAWKIPDEAFVVVFGSSRPGEEEMLRDALPVLQKEIPNLYIVLVPRHLTRLEEIKEIFSNEKYELFSDENRLKSALPEDRLKSALPEDRLKSVVQTTQLLIIDKMGVLVEAYGLADLAIIGGSFYDFGGHNPLEAAFYGLPIVMGKFYSSCRDSVAKLQEAQAIRISETASFAEDIVELANNTDLRRTMGTQAMSVMEKYSHSIEINLKTIEKWI